jgi:hypothetical protein
VIGVDGDGGMHGRAVSHGECRWGWWSCLGDAVPLVSAGGVGGHVWGMRFLWSIPTRAEASWCLMLVG